MPSALPGVFFYMGIASLTGNNLFDRLFLYLIWEPKTPGKTELNWSHLWDCSTMYKAVMYMLFFYVIISLSAVMYNYVN